MREVVVAKDSGGAAPGCARERAAEQAGVESFDGQRRRPDFGLCVRRQRQDQRHREREQRRGGQCPGGADEPAPCAGGARVTRRPAGHEPTGGTGS